MTLSPVEPNVSDISCLRPKIVQIYKWRENAQAQHTEEVLFGLKIKRAGISFFNGKGLATEQSSGSMGKHRLIESCHVFKGVPIAISINAIVISRTRDSGV
jgi:hypothetical protein